jgi:hypothetical protein
MGDLVGENVEAVGCVVPECASCLESLLVLSLGLFSTFLLDY